MVRRSSTRSVSPRIEINERIKRQKIQAEKNRIKIVKEERKKAIRNLKKLGVTHLGGKRI